MNKNIEEFCELVDSARNRIVKLGSVSLMPDYFVDRYVRVTSIEDLYRAILRKSSGHGGGSVRGVKQGEAKGGNAVNTAYALGKFGADVCLLAIADGLASLTLAGIFRSYPNVKLEIVKGATGYTVAFEFVRKNCHTNVMVSEAGDLAEFDGGSIPESYWRRVKRSKIACVLNWGANRKGTDLCERVFSQARKHGARTFMDPADPLELKDRLPSLRSRVFDKGLVDILSLNENEASIFSRAFLDQKLPRNHDFRDLEKVVRGLSEVTGGTVDLHTRGVGISFKSGDCVKAKCHRVEQKTITGAGDVWDAADVLGHLADWSPEDRLRFANAAAGLYVSRETAEPPSLPEVTQFVREHPT